jgi:hypothetical protein
MRVLKGKLTGVKSEGKEITVNTIFSYDSHFTGLFWQIEGACL